MLNIFKSIAIIGLIIAGLTTLGFAINEAINWGFLNVAFVVLRQVISPLDVIIDVPTFIKVLSNIFSSLVAFWVARGLIAIIKQHKTN